MTDPRTGSAPAGRVPDAHPLPAAANEFFSGLRISATYAIVGAVIAEWLGGFSGLGVYMTRVRKSFSYDKMFAVIILISALIRGTYHLYQGFGGFVGNIAMGVIFAAWFLRTGRVWPLVIAHFLIDAVAFTGYPLVAPWLESLA